MPKCPNCGAIFEEGAKYCPQCGEPIREENKDKNNIISVEPTNDPEAINYHLESDDGENWIKKPGALAVSLTVKDTENVSKEIEDIFKPLINLSNKVENSNLLRDLRDCKGKLYAVEYHLKTINEEIGESIKDFEESYKASSGAAIERENPILIYETESFLFQIKSNLDILVHIVGDVIPAVKSFHTFKHSGQKGTNKYRSGGKIIDKLLEVGEDDLAEIIDKNRKEWIQKITKWRDTITHYSRLRNFHCFVEEPYTGKEKVNIHYPSMPSGERLDLYCISVYKSLCSFYKEIFKKLEERIEKGNR